MNRSDSIAELAAALAKAQGAIKGAAKDSANPFFKSKYADLASVWDACRKPLSDNGLAVVQLPTLEDCVVKVETVLTHASGQYIGGTLAAAPKDVSPQGIGSTVTYLRRYALAAIAGVAPEDDDGEVAEGRGSFQPPQQHRQPPPRAQQRTVEVVSKALPQGNHREGPKPPEPDIPF